ncbi:MAG: alpha-galactosidase [Planctomycetota bacterium]|jgi:hypothetical protein
MKRNLLLVLIIGISTAFVSSCVFAEAVPGKEMLKTDDTMIELSATTDGLSVSRLSNGEQGWNWVSKESVVPLLEKAFNMDAEQQSLNWKLEDVKPESDKDGKKVTVTFVNKNPLLKIRSIWLAHPGPGAIEHTVEMINESDKPVLIGLVPGLNLMVKPPPKAELEHIWVEKGARMPTNYGIHRSAIKGGFDYKGLSTPYDESEEDSNVPHEPIGWQCIQVDSNKHGIYTGIESTGFIMQQARLEGSCPDKVLRIILGIDESPSEFRTILKPKEVYTFPTIFIGCYKGDVDDGCNRLHRWVERWLSPQSDDPNLPWLVNNSWGAGMTVDEKMAMSMIDDCVDLGIEMYHVDAGWYKQVGWWKENDKFPSGLRKVSDYAHSKGLKFGLWVAWSNGGHARGKGKQALSPFNPMMRKWFGRNIRGWWQAGNYIGEPVCLAYEPAMNWCIRDLRRIIKEYNLDLLEHDQQMVVKHYLNNEGDISHRAAQGYYKVHKTLLKEFPNLIIENCVNGGRMVDFGAVKYSHYTCANDKYDPMSLRRAFYDTSFPMPPRIIEGYLSRIDLGNTLEQFRYNIRSALLGWCSIMMDASDMKNDGAKAWSKKQREAAKRQFEVYKKDIRPQIREGNLYHVSNRPKPNGWDAFQYHLPSAGKGIVFVFRAECEDSEITVKLKGLEPNAKYKVDYEDGYGQTIISVGKDLMENGIKVKLPCKKSSELVYLTKKGN